MQSARDVLVFVLAALVICCSAGVSLAKEREFSIYFSVGQGALHKESAVICAVVNPLNGALMARAQTDKNGKVKVKFPWDREENGQHVEVYCVAADGRADGQVVMLSGLTTKVKLTLPPRSPQ